MDKLFKEFSQVDASVSRKYGGTGLGLAISRQLVAMMGGQIGAESSGGEGALFWFSVRLAKQISGACREGADPQTLKGIPVLIIDGNRSVREMLRAQMTYWGMQVFEAEDLSGGSKILAGQREARDPILIVLMNVQRPDSFGARTIQYLPAEFRAPEPCVVLLVSMSYRVDAERLELEGIASVLRKPVHRKDLRYLLEQLLCQGKRRAVREYGPSASKSPEENRNDSFAGSQVRVLLAEDNLTNQQVALGILGHLGVVAKAVANGEEVLEELGSRVYDVVFMDVQMPGMDGLEATRRIRGPGSPALNSQIPVIAMTAHAMQGDREVCLAAGMNDYVAKPVSPQAIAAALKKWSPQGSPRRSRVQEEPGEETGAPESDAASLCWDMDGILEALMGDHDLLREIVEQFLVEMDNNIRNLGVLLERNEIDQARGLVHTIKGAAATVRAEELRRAAEVEEASLRETTSLRLKWGSDKSDSCSARLRERINHYLSGAT